MSLVLPKISRFSEKKNLACEEYDYIVYPTGGEKTYSSSERIDFIINQQTSSRLMCINGSQSYGTIQANFENPGAVHRPELLRRFIRSVELYAFG